MAFDVFLSYARADTARAEQIKNLLENLGLSVFFDTEGLDGGDVFPDVLDREVKAAGAIVGVWSKHALTRPWVKIECDIGRARGVLVPIQIEQIADLDRPAAFWNIQFADLSDFDGHTDHVGWLRFVRALARTLNREDLLTTEVASQPADPTDQSSELRAELAAMRAQMSEMANAKEALAQSVRSSNSDPAATPEIPPATRREASSTSQKKSSGNRYGMIAALLLVVAALGFAGKWYLDQSAQTASYSWQQMSNEDWIRQDVMTLLRRVESETALSELSAVAEAGSAAAYTAQGLAQRESYRIQQGEAGARLSFRAGCNRDHIPACFFLGGLYTSGRGGAVDLDAAGQLFNKACTAQLLEACYALARIYDASPDPEYQLAASEFYRYACDGGLVVACGPQPPSTRAADDPVGDAASDIAGFETACSNGESAACARAASAYLYGEGVSEDREKGKSLYQDACNIDDMEACWLGGILHEQDGDLDLARAQYDRACQGGFIDGCEELALLVKKRRADND